MKLLTISCVSLTCGGAERVISLLSSYFINHYDTVEIVMWKDAPIFYTFDKRIKITNIEKEINSTNYVKKILWFRQYLKLQKPFAVLSFLAKSSIGVLTAAFGTKVPIIVAERNDPRQLKGGWAMIKIRDFLYNFAAGILEQTEHNKKYFRGIKLKKTSVIHNPVLMSPDIVGSALKGKKDNTIISVGRLEPQKNQALLINTFSRVHKRHPEYNLVIYGEGTLRAKLEILIQKLGLTDCVFLPGNKSNIFDYEKKAKLFVMTSNFEGMANALIEAMCIGLPCISTKVSGATDLINNGNNGILVDVGNEVELEEKILSLVENEEKMNFVATNAVKVFDHLKIEKIAKQWINYLDHFA
jgi:glycosyltransferase involved in cell wall biosynthesis